MRLVAAGAAAAAAAATAVYAGTLECGFVWDDVRAIRGNRDVLVGLRGDLWDLDLLKNDFWGDAMDHDKSHRSYRPLAVWTFRLDAYRGRILDGHGNAYVNPRPFHETNVLLHALASALVGWLCAVLLLAQNEAPEQRPIVANPSNGKKERGKQSSKHIAQSESRHSEKEPMDAVALPCTAAALLFAVHSIHTEAVAGLVGRADILASIFFILAIGVYERYRIASVAAALAIVSTLCKETGLTALGYCIFSELLSWRGKPSAARVAMLVAVIAMAVRTRLALHQGKGLYAWTVMENHIALEPSLWTRICSYAHTHALYLKLLIYPRGLSYHHGFGTVPLHETPSPLSVCAYALLLLVCTMAMVWRDKRLARILALSLLPFVPASNVLFPIGAILAERLLYIPSAGACVLLALVLHRSRHAWKRTYRVLCLVLAIYVSFLSVWTVERNKDWMSDLTLFEAGLREHPTNIGALSNVGYMYMQDDSNHTKLVTARELFLRATSLHPRFATAWLNLSVVARKLGNDTEAMHALRELLSVDPQHCRGKASLADILASRVEIARGGAGPSQVQEAMEAAEHASTNCPKTPLAPYALARLLVLKAHESDEIDHAKEALATFEEALRRSDDLPLDSPEKLVHGNVLNEMALFAQARDDTQTALTLWERAQAIRDVSGAVLSNAAVQGWLHAVRTYGADNVKFTFPNGTEVSGLERAQELMARALEAEPKNGLVMANAGWLHEVQGNLLAAQKLYMGAHKLAGDHPSIMNSIKRVQDLLVAEESAPAELV